jgi:hypothetical protein
MVDKAKALIERAKLWPAHAVELSRAHRVRKIGVIVMGIIALYGLLGFVGVPLSVYYIVTPRISASINRPVSIARFRFNPYRLKVDIEKLHIGDRGGSKEFVDVGHIRVKASWTSLFRIAPVVGELTVERPTIHLVRNAEGGFNFSDLLGQPNEAPAEKPKETSSGSPMLAYLCQFRVFHFALSLLKP